MPQHHQSCVFSANKCMWLFPIPTKGGGSSWGGRGPTAAPACQAELLTALFMFQKLSWERQDIIQDADGVATQRLLPSSLENIGKSLLWKECKDAHRSEERWLRFPSGARWVSVGGRVYVFSATEQMIKYLRKKDKWLQSLFWVGPQAHITH